MSMVDMNVAGDSDCYPSGDYNASLYD